MTLEQYTTLNLPWWTWLLPWRWWHLYRTQELQSRNEREDKILSTLKDLSDGITGLKALSTKVVNTIDLAIASKTDVQAAVDGAVAGINEASTAISTATDSLAEAFAPVEVTA